MQKPFDVTSLLGDIANEITTDSPDTFGQRANHPRVQRRVVGVQTSEDIQPGPKDAGEVSQTPVEIDYVNHPPHYNAHPSGVECIVVTEWMNFCLGNCIKYIWRADEKGETIEDLRKARWYLDREIKRLEGMIK